MKKRKNYTQLIAIPLQMIVIIALGFWGGAKLNNYLGYTKPILTLIIGFIGMIAALYLTITKLNKFFDENNKN